MTRMRIFARSALASGAVTLVLLAGPSVAGCTGGGDMLRVAVLDNNAASAKLNAARAAHEAALQADLERRFATCPESPQSEHRACVQRETVAALNAAARESLELNSLAHTEGEAARALEAAAQCKASHTSCEADYVAEAERHLAMVKAGLILRERDAGAGGAP